MVKGTIVQLANTISSHQSPLTPSSSI